MLFTNLSTIITKKSMLEVLNKDFPLTWKKLNYCDCETSNYIGYHICNPDEKLDVARFLSLIRSRGEVIGFANTSEPIRNPFEVTIHVFTGTKYQLAHVKKWIDKQFAGSPIFYRYNWYSARYRYIDSWGNRMYWKRNRKNVETLTDENVSAMLSSDVLVQETYYALSHYKEEIFNAGNAKGNT